ncbi:adrenocorticotropic hormone receptor-like [Porites lutea]|uniref:adrenocorticotropic hormone receptor-like n=1 Tax=Porites lutea TaxID=51062 RepID=UPI003CC58847
MGNYTLPKWKFILLLNVHGIITIVALVGSYFVLRAFHKFRSLRTASNNILVSLSIADGLLAIPLILDIILLCLMYNFGDSASHMLDILKEVEGTITLFLLSVIVLHLSLMSSERFIAIRFALRYQAIVTKRRARIVSIAMWLWALVIVIALPWTLYGITGHNDFREFPREMHQDSDKAQELNIRWHLVFTAASMFLVPLLIIICSYTYIFIVSYKQRQRVRKQGRDVPGMPTVKHEMKGARTLAIVVALCLLSIIPILVVTSLRVFWSKLLGGHLHQKLLQHIVYNVAMFLNAACNPLFYGWRNEEFRNAFRKMLKCC